MLAAGKAFPGMSIPRCLLRPELARSNNYFLDSYQYHHGYYNGYCTHTDTLAQHLYHLTLEREPSLRSVPSGRCSCLRKGIFQAVLLRYSVPEPLNS